MLCLLLFIIPIFHIFLLDILKNWVVLVFLYYYCSRCLYMPWLNFGQLWDSPRSTTLVGDFSHPILLVFPDGMDYCEHRDECSF